MDNYSIENKKYLLNLARKTIEKKIKKVWLTENEINNLDPILKEKRGCFVTLHINNELRGCIGYILPLFPLYQSVIENAYNAAYSDPRFLPVSKDEIPKLNIEISILTIPVKLNYKDRNDLLNKLIPEVDGVIIKKNFHSATFLPQVWEQLPKKEDFLNHLCLKAGLAMNEWEKGTLEIETYKAIVFKED